MDKEQWISQILESTKGLEKTNPSSFLFEKISQKINSTDIHKISFYERAVFKRTAIATLLVLALLNISSVILQARRPAPKVISLGKELMESTTYNY